MAANLRRLSRTTLCQADAQCLHGGHCVRTQGAVFHNPGEFNYCSCAESFGGQRCESFCPLQCQNGGICYAKGGGSSTKPEEATAADPEHPFSSDYACKCLGRWTGTVCDVAYENCGNGLQCFNGGTCVLAEGEQENDYYECRCPAGYGGPSCRDESLLTEATQQRDALLGISKTGAALLSLAMVVLPGLALILLRRRRQRHQAYDTVFHNDSDTDFQYEFSVSNRGQTEKWRNVV